MRIYFFVILSCCVLCLEAQNTNSIPNTQLPVIQAPQLPGAFPSYSNGTQPTNPYNLYEATDIRKRNEALIREATEFQRRIDSRQQKETEIKMLAIKGFPSQSYQKGTSCYYHAFDEICNMLKGNQPLNLARTVFLVENAYYGDSLNYAQYRKTIRDNIQFCNQKIRDEKLNKEDNMVKNMMLFRFVSDTLSITPPGSEKKVTHLPVRYDYNDYKSEKHFDSHFVTKLMRSGIGQCLSMPLYYLILAEAMGAKAYWSFSPQHSFVKIQDKTGEWYNIELTCSAILSDAHYMNSSYIKAEAIRHRIYLEPMDKKQIIAEMLVHLAQGYYRKYGMDDFYLKCADTSMLYLNNKLNALMLKASYEENLTLTLAYLMDAKKPEVMKEKSPESYKHYEKMQSLNKQIDDLGYEDLPDRIYASWLAHIAKMKEKYNNKKLK